MLFVMGISAGLFIVPIHAFIQLRSPSQRRGEILAASGFLGWVGIALAAGLLWVLTQIWAHLGITEFYDFRRNSTGISDSYSDNAARCSFWFDRCAFDTAVLPD